MTFPFVGHTYRFDYDGFVAVDSFTDTGVSFEIVEGPGKGLAGQANYTARELAPKIYAISWQEADGATVVHIDDYNAWTSLSYFTDAARNFYQMRGSISPAD